jgi:hypothetical protein
VPLAPPRRGGIRGLPLLAVLGVALLALRLGVRVVTLVKTRGAAVEAANQQQEQQQRLQQSDSRKAQVRQEIRSRVTWSVPVEQLWLTGFAGLWRQRACEHTTWLAFGSRHTG